jgi:DNA modification methylase
MKTESNQEITIKPLLNTITHGNCVDLMAQMPDASVDFVLTDPPYVARYRTSDGRTVPNDNFVSLSPAMTQAYRVLRPHNFAVVFYGWVNIAKYVDAFRNAGFRVVGHLVFRKRYTSARRYLAYRHEAAYLLAKGNPFLAADPIADMRDWDFTGNKLHPTQKPVSSLLPLVEAFSQRGHIVLDPFCGSGSSLAAAKQLGRQFIGFDISADYAAIAARRLCAHPRG